MSGVLNLVSMGPGSIEQCTPAAIVAIAESEVVVGYELYLRPVAKLIDSKQVIALPLTQERERAAAAILNARLGKTVALVSSGDVGIYAMATLAFEQMTEEDTFKVRVYPGVTAANACAALLGAPLSHDFATLSLSDLLCPWSWIEERARNIAKADLAVALYNVQSKTRQSGIYRILEIMLAHKKPGTRCGVVRNAYRAEQSIKLFKLEQLLEQEFDMLTTIIIGNRYTVTRRGWLYTPRGYSSWEAPEDASPVATSPGAISPGATSPGAISPGATSPVASQEIPKGAIWVFSGTGDGNVLANRLIEEGYSVVLSVASTYGAEVAATSCPEALVISGHLGIDQRRAILQRCSPLTILDATHPHALAISRQLISLARDLHIPYLRLERPEADLDPDICTSVDTVAEAANLAVSLGARIFLATGVKHLEEILSIPGASIPQWFLRLTPDQESISKAIACGLPRANICAMQGPFSAEINRALWSQWQIDCIITKESGDKFGLKEKQLAAKQLGLPLIVIARPKINYPSSTSNEEAVLKFITSLRSNTCQVSYQ